MVGAMAGGAARQPGGNHPRHGEPCGDEAVVDVALRLGAAARGLQPSLGPRGETPRAFGNDERVAAQGHRADDGPDGPGALAELPGGDGDARTAHESPSTLAGMAGSCSIRCASDAMALAAFPYAPQGGGGTHPVVRN